MPVHGSNPNGHKLITSTRALSFAMSSIATQIGEFNFLSTALIFITGCKEYVASLIGLYKRNKAVLCVGINFVTLLVTFNSFIF